MMYLLEDVKDVFTEEGFDWLEQVEFLPKDKLLEAKGIRVCFSQYSGHEFGFYTDHRHPMSAFGQPSTDKAISGVWVKDESLLEEWCYNNDLSFNGFQGNPSKDHIGVC